MTVIVIGGGHLRREGMDFSDGPPSVNEITVWHRRPRERRSAWPETSQAGHHDSPTGNGAGLADLRNGRRSA